MNLRTLKFVARDPFISKEHQLHAAASAYSVGHDGYIIPFLSDWGASSDKYTPKVDTRKITQVFIKTFDDGLTTNWPKLINFHLSLSVAYCDRLSRSVMCQSVCMSVCHADALCKNCSADRGPILVETLVDPMLIVLMMEPQCPYGEAEGNRLKILPIVK